MTPPETEQRHTCLLTGLPGYVRRTRTGVDLAAAYKAHFNLTIPERLTAAYFQGTFSECECRKSGLRWYEPATAAGSDFYEFLSESLEWYYSPITWDKAHALTTLKRIGAKSIFEAGCGAGHLLKAARAAGLSVEGSELNAAQHAAALASGLRVHSVDTLPASCPADAMVMLQVLEHITHPLEFTRDLVERIRPRHLLIAVPGHETLLGVTTDPLVWPPHHISSWSHQSFAILADKLGATLREVSYEPLDWSRFQAAASRETEGRLPGLPSVTHPRRLRLAYRIGRLLRRPWAMRAHTVFAVLEFLR